MKEKLFLPIVVDIETSGVDKFRCGVWQIGAYDLSTGEEFLQEARIDNEDEIINEPGSKKLVLEAIGKTEEELRDKNKQSQKHLIKKFFDWVEKRRLKNFLCQNPQFDVAFLEIKAKKYGIKKVFHYRSFDLHSIVQLKYMQLNGKFLIEEDHSGMGLTNILIFCGMKDERKAHNALEDAKLTAECFYRLMIGKNLFSEYSKFPVPRELLK